MRYLPLTPEDRTQMLAVIGVASIDDLFIDVPALARRDGFVDLPAAAELDFVARAAPGAGDQEHLRSTR